MITLDTETMMLRKVPIFEHLPEDQLRRLAFASQRYAFADGETIIRQGESGDRAFLVLNGKVDISHRSSQEDRVLTAVDAGAMFGDHATLSNVPYKVTATAVGPVEVLAVARDTFLDLLEGDSDAMAQILRGLTERGDWVERTYSVTLD